MAIFKAPRITTAQRLPLLLQASEIVYDLDTKSFWGGNGSTLGGFPLGAGSSEGATQVIVLSQENINNKSATLSRLPLSPEFISLEVVGGILQLYSVDYTIIGQEISWDGLGLDNFLEAGDILVVNYVPFIGGLTGGATEIINLTQQNIENKFVQLQGTPPEPENVKLQIVGGISQLYNDDFVINGNILSWNQKGLDNFLEINDTLFIQF